MMPRQGTVVADRYRLERKVGGGRVSAMWRVQDQVSDANCAIKLLHRSMNDHPEALARFSLEDRLSRELTGDYFPERVGSGSWHSLRYIAWRWYEGECLRSLFERTPKQDVQTVYSIVQEACQALALVHGAGYTHGDLKPENLFFADLAGDSSRQLKLLGFGVASRVARPLLGSQARRTPGQIVGTPLYLSPDLILGRVPRGGQADLWALAVIVYEALTGRAPFLGTELSEVLEAILERRAARPSTITNLPGTFDVWWTQALEQQFATTAEFSTSLARALAPALRSSRTQRSASLPERISPVGQGLVWRTDVATPRAPEATEPPAEAPPAEPHPAAQRAADAVFAPAGGHAAADLVAVPERRTSPGGVIAPVSRALQTGSGQSSVRQDGNSLSREAVSAPRTDVARRSAAAKSTAAASAAMQPAAAMQSATAANVAALAAAASASPGGPGGTLVASAAVAASSMASSMAASAASSAVASDAFDLSANVLSTNALTGSTLPTNPLSTAALSANGLGSSPSGSTAAGLGRARDATPLMAGAKAKTDSTPGRSRRDPPRPEPSASRPSSRPLQHGADANDLTPAEPQRQGPSITSTTVAGIGPAALSLMRSRESAKAAAAASTAAGRVPKDVVPKDVAKDVAKDVLKAATYDAGREPQPEDTFGPLPWALRDLGVGTRKTLVGIIAPSFPAQAAPVAAPVPQAVAQAAPAATRPVQSLAIAGAPCRSIDVTDDDEAMDSVVPLRRLGNATVPYPRPRAASRSAPAEDEGLGDQGYIPQSPQSWRNRTSNTLHVVLTDPGYRPHLVAGLLVCSAAALVIFALGRSPVSGTGLLGQTTGSLSGRESAAAEPSRSGSTSSLPAIPGPGAPDPAGAAASGAAVASALQGEELAPGLVVPPPTAVPPNAVPPNAVPPTAVPPNAAPPNAAPPNAVPPNGLPSSAQPSSAKPMDPAKATPPSPLRSAPVPPPGRAEPARAPAGPASGALPAAPPLPTSTPPRATPPRKPGTDAPLPRPGNPDFDFGI
ncbi:MAG: hypothetical protein RL685_5389 [Pseudomonadota bacterium]|jgi:serine/threonine-protein kinase